ncbi:MAG: UDP-N-acetylmuramoyl-L-alanine--D-glutamate ligase, partial [Comamonas sp.]|nr:UDP-N-acetylmuramoyl-L-alanine--D-glutamate ligase [Comamonas sp.]
MPHTASTTPDAVALAVVVTDNLGAVSVDESTFSDVNVSETQGTQALQAPEVEVTPVWAEPVPDVASLTAAKDAAAFVAQIFTDPSMSDAGDAEVTTAQPAADVPAVDWPPVPVQWPLGQAQHLQGQHVLILGLGASGISMARWCTRAGAQVTVADTREAPPQLELLRTQLPEARFIGGPLSRALVDGQSLTSVYRSPGLTPDTIAPVVDAARAIGLPVGGELDLFAAALQGLNTAHGYQPKVLAITGTNGKTTVTSLTGKLLEHAGIHAAVAGNIGPTLLDTLGARIDAEDLPQAWVLELSSFQLDG